ncbi:hypothetical protein D3C86_1491830 [compost metagenome]
MGEGVGVAEDLEVAAEAFAIGVKGCAGGGNLAGRDRRGRGEEGRGGPRLAPDGLHVGLHAGDLREAGQQIALLAKRHRDARLCQGRRQGVTTLGCEGQFQQLEVGQKKQGVTRIDGALPAPIPLEIAILSVIGQVREAVKQQGRQREALRYGRIATKGLAQQQGQSQHRPFRVAIDMGAGLAYGVGE